MMGIARVGIVVAATLVVLAISAAAFVGSGIYDIGADDHHTKIVLAIIEQLRERSIAVRSGVIEVPNLDDSSRIALGAERYAATVRRLSPGTRRQVRSAPRPLSPPFVGGGGEIAGRENAGQHEQCAGAAISHAFERVATRGSEVLRDTGVSFRRSQETEPPIGRTLEGKR